jgi:putative acetyltransferase
MNILNIREETGLDAQKIGEVTKTAFAHHPYSSHTEHLIVAALRCADALLVSLVAEVDGRLVGHVAFLSVTISDGSRGWYGLGPVSVDPDFQKQGIGRALIAKGLALLREAGANGCVVLGEPGYYERFGFKNNPGIILENVPQEYFMVLPFNTNSAKGSVTYHEAFSVQG